ncbi:hypothetical protein [Photorhabdus namnaonensis]|nr:hypothetical protein [Photorhabdus namnaonensis]
MPEHLITLLPADMTPAIYPLGNISSEGACSPLFSGTRFVCIDES